MQVLSSTLQEAVSYRTRSVYNGACCPFCVDAHRWGNRKKGGRHKEHNARTGTNFRSHRKHKEKVLDVLKFEKKRWES